MTWATFYLICFLFGFVFSALSLLSGFGHLHLPLKWHLPHLGHGGGPGAGVHAGSGSGVAHGPGGAHATATVAGARGAPSGTGAGGSAGIPPINFFTLMAFLTWFGGTGYLLTQYSSIWFALGLVIASLSGAAGSAVIFVFLTRVVLAHEAEFEQEVFSMVGVLGRLSVSIGEGGTGEMVYSHGGTRHTCGARSEDGQAIPRKAEVVVTCYEKGIAYVRRWEDMTQ
jgi:hypothetical protein